MPLSSSRRNGHYSPLALTMTVDCHNVTTIVVQPSGKAFS